MAKTGKQVVDQNLRLAGYYANDWMNGRTSSNDSTLEQAIVESGPMPDVFGLGHDILPSHKLAGRRDSLNAEVLESETTSNGAERYDISPLVRLRSQNPIRRVEVLQQFEGVTTEVGDDYFIAQMHDLTNSDCDIELMEFDLREISSEDRKILKPGTVFYWTIGYETRIGGQVLRISELRVQRTPIWTKTKLDSVAANASEIFEKLNEDNSP